VKFVIKAYIVKLQQCVIYLEKFLKATYKSFYWVELAGYMGDAKM
jgi:hypothetical protein